MINKKREFFFTRRTKENNKQVPNNPFSEVSSDNLRSEILQMLQEIELTPEVEEILRGETQNDLLPF